MYQFIVNFYNTYGSFDIDADNYEEACAKASDLICDAIKDLPVEVEYDVECIDEPDDYEEDKEDE